MSRKNAKTSKDISEDTAFARGVERQDDRQFAASIESLIDEAENLRLKRMRQHQTRGFISMTLGLLSILIGAGAFGWFLLVKGDVGLAVLSMMLAVALPLFLHFWAEHPITLYRTDYKREFMPKMANALGGLKFYPKRGISADIIKKTAVIPPHHTYHAEDCFMGLYEGVKVFFSEARLFSRSQRNIALFDGIFVLLEIPEKRFSGHTIMTADESMVKRWRKSRWKTLEQIDVQTSNADWNRFHAFSTKPDAARAFLNDSLLKELSETMDVFEQAPLTAVLFRQRYVFLSIPYAQNMFEASHLHVPITTKQHALKCKKEIDQLLEIIDIFNVYSHKKGIAGRETESLSSSAS